MRQVTVALLVFLILVLSFPPVGTCAKKEDSYVIGREDVLDITVWQSPDLTKTLTVESDGSIDYPILGNLQVSGLSAVELKKILEEKLAQGYVKNPQVSVSIKEYNSKKILVFGEVGNPGLYKLKSEIPVLELLFMTGGAKADAKRMTVIRAGKNSDGSTLPVPIPSQEGPNPIAALDTSSAIEIDLIALLSKGDLSQNVMIFPGDTVYVASGTGLRYYVLGQVANPGPYEWSQDITVLEAVKLAGGVKERGAPNRIKVRKYYKGEKHEIKVNMLDIMKGKKKDDVVIKPGDTIIVPESWI